MRTGDILSAMKVISATGCDDSDNRWYSVLSVTEGAIGAAAAAESAGTVCPNCVCDIISTMGVV